MKPLLIAAIVLAMAGSAFAQSQTPTHATPDADYRSGFDNHRMQKGGPASKESPPGAGGQQGLVKSNPGIPDASKVPSPSAPR
jgi:hypothetical protein